MIVFCLLSGVKLYVTIILNSNYYHFKIGCTYKISKTLSAEASYAMLHDENENTADDGFTPYDGGYDRLLVRLDYNF